MVSTKNYKEWEKRISERAKEMSSCMAEANIDTAEIALRRRLEDLLSQGDLEGAEKVEEALENLDNVPVCEE